MQVFHLRMRRHQRRQRRSQRFDRVAQVGGEGVAVARRTGGGVGDPARRHDHAVALLLAFEAPLVDIAHAEYAVAQRHDLRHARFIADLHAVVHAVVQQSVGNVPGLAAFREDAFAAFDVEFHALAFEEADRRPVVEFRECRSEESGVGAYLLGELLRRPGVGHVAAAFARYAYLAARFLHFFQQQDPFAAPRRRACRHHARRARTHDNNVVGQPFGRLCCFRLFHTGAKVVKLKIKNGNRGIKNCPVLLFGESSGLNGPLGSAAAAAKYFRRGISDC